MRAVPDGGELSPLQKHVQPRFNKFNRPVLSKTPKQLVELLEDLRRHHTPLIGVQKPYRKHVLEGA
jgi:hypothetical protein